MSLDEAIRESWATRMGFIFAAVGSAVGLGNVWRFPFQVGQEGGAAFLLLYLLFVVFIGLPAILVEFVIGRKTELSPWGALREFGGEAWRYAGGMFVVIGFIILSYYSVVAGWVIRYFFGSFTGAYMEAPGEYFGSIATGMDALALHAVFMLLVIGIVAFGVRQGIELSVKLMVPAIVILMVGFAVYVATLPGVGEAYSYYLSPDFGYVAANWQSIIPAAAGQAFFTLSLGMGVMITYASYLGEDRNMVGDSLIIAGFDTGVAFVAGLVVFPILFASGIGPSDPGAGAIFVALAGAFAEIPGGQILGLLFFGTFALAALSSAISLLEVPVSYAIDEFGVDRTMATIGIGIGVFLLGVPVAFELIFLDLLDMLAAQVLLVLGGIFLVILVGWLNPQEGIEELEKGITNIGMGGQLWIWLVRIPVLLVLLVSFWLAVQGYVDFLQTDFAGWLAG